MTFEFVKTTAGADPIVVEAYLEATPATVFEAFTDPDIVLRWFGPQPNSLKAATIDLRIGGAWCFVESTENGQTIGFEGEYVCIEPAVRLVFTWSKFSTDSKGERVRTHPSKVALSLAPSGRGTLLRVVHSSIGEDKMRFGFANGWERGLKNLREMMGRK